MASQLTRIKVDKLMLIQELEDANTKIAQL